MSRLLVLAPQGLGDSLEATPMLAALRAALPSAVLDVAVTRPAALDLFSQLPQLVDSTIYLPYWEKGKAAFLQALLQSSWRKTYDAAFLCYPAARVEYQAMLLAYKARKRYTHDYGGRRLTSLRWLGQTVVPVRYSHNVLRNMDLLTAADIPWARPTAYTAPTSWISADTRAGDHVVLHVGSVAHDGLEQRRWPLENFIEVARGLARDGYRISAVIGPNEVEETQKLLAAVPTVAAIEGRLDAVARALSKASLVIANDNGIAHVSAAVRTPTISLFGPTPLFHAPFGPESRPLRVSACPPCFDVRLLNTDCAHNIGYACIRQDLTPAIVLREARAIMTARTESAIAASRTIPG